MANLENIKAGDRVKECGEWDAEQLNKQIADAKRRADEEAIRLKGVELHGLFPTR